MDYIEEVIKKPGNDLSAVQMVEGDFSGLECRWNQIPSDKDEVLSVIIKSTIEDEKERSLFYRKCFQMIEEIYGDESEYAPVSEEKMSLTMKPMLLQGEISIRTYPATLMK